MNKKVIIIILGFLILVFILLFFMYKTNFLMMLKKSESLNYHKDIYEEIDHVIITSFKGERFTKGSKSIAIRDPKDIEKILNFLNSLELVKFDKGKGPRRYIYDEGSFGIAIVLKNDSDFADVVFFMSDYLIFYNEKYRSEQHRMKYYIKNSGYNSKDKTSKAYYFLYDIINK